MTDPRHPDYPLDVEGHAFSVKPKPKSADEDTAEAQDDDVEGHCLTQGAIDEIDKDRDSSV